MPMSDTPEHDSGTELLIRLAQEANAGIDGAQIRYRRELLYRASLWADDQSYRYVQTALDNLVREVAQARDAELEATARRRGLA